MTSVHYQQSSPQPVGGGWLAIVHENSVLLVDSSGAASGATSLDALWRSLGSSDGIKATLDLLTRGGLSATPPFALVQWEENSEFGAVRAIVRGAVTLTVDTEDGASTTADARGVSTWLEQQYPSVRSFELRVGSRSEASVKDESLLLPLQSGVAGASRIVVDRTSLRTVVTPSSGAAGAPTLVGSAPTPPAAERPTAPSPPWIDPEATVSGLSVIVDAAPAAPTPAAPHADGVAKGSDDSLFGETVFRAVQDAGVRDEGKPASEANADANANADADAEPNGVAADLDAVDSPATGDHDGHTIASSDIAKLRAGRKARGTAHPPASAPSPRLYLELADGSREPLTQPILVGRAPSVSKVSGGQMPKLLTAAGSDQDISRNHAQFAVEGETVVVTDLHSRNGTTIILPGRSPQQLRQGEPTSVIVGTVVDLGGGVTFTVGEE